ncbi:TetR/AcrR family transcriptional regulator [Actinomadura fulvescens]|uniref:HTH tetR-type domain-containing protein n=1 Tax=Actinomadura fulvescens TaxID=46160 RepID=A0ABN3QP57_9ACTN
MVDDVEPTGMFERLVEVATGLFAELGYDATSTEMVAESAGVSVTTVRAEIGGKRDIYLAVMKQTGAQEQVMLEDAVAEFTPDAAGVHRFLDRYLDFFLAHPYTAALWMQRRLFDAADIADMEKIYSIPQLQLVAQKVGGAFGPGVDVEFSLWTVVWCVHSFVQGGIPAPGGERLGRHDHRTVARFRAHLHHMVGRMVGIDDWDESSALES